MDVNVNILVKDVIKRLSLYMEYKINPLMTDKDKQQYVNQPIDDKDVNITEVRECRCV